MSLLKLLRETTSLSNLVSKSPKQQRQRRQNHTQTTQHRHRPVYTQRLVHFHISNHHASRNYISHEGNGRQSARTFRLIRIDDILVHRHKDAVQTPAKECCRDKTVPVTDIVIVGPPDPEQTDGQKRRCDNCRPKSILWFDFDHRFFVRRALERSEASTIGSGIEGLCAGVDQDTQADSTERITLLARREPICVREDVGESLKVGEDKNVNNSQVKPEANDD